MSGTSQAALPTEIGLIRRVEVVHAYSKQSHLLPRLAKAMDLAVRTAGQRPTVVSTPAPYKVIQRLGTDEIAAIVAAYQAGKTCTGLAREYGVAKATVLRMLDQARVPRRRQSLSADAVKTAIHLYSLGCSLEQVGQKLGYDHGTVMHALERAGVQRRDTHGRPR